jgi:Domain of unknown function (DUF4190)
LSETPNNPGWWLASDGRWYPPGAQPGPVQAPPPPAFAYPHSGYYTGSTPQSTNDLAIVAFVLSILWVFGLGSLLAIILALVARSKIKASHGAQSGAGMATAGLVIGICGLIGSVGLFAILHVAVGSHRLNSVTPGIVKQATVNDLGTTVTLGDDRSGAGVAKVLVQDVAYPVSIGVATGAIASVRVCAGVGGSRSGASSYAFRLGFGRGKEAHTGPDSIPNLSPNACTDAELYFVIPPDSKPTYAAYDQFRWLIPVS